METIINKTLTILALGFLMNNSAHAFNPKNKISDFSETNKLIQEHVKFNNELVNNLNGSRVNVVFTLDELNCINLVIVNTKNVLLKNEIEKQLMNIQLNNLKPNNTYSITFNFKTI
jgi:hypothetical protein